MPIAQLDFPTPEIHLRKLYQKRTSCGLTAAYQNTPRTHITTSYNIKRVTCPTCLYFEQTLATMEKSLR